MAELTHQQLDEPSSKVLHIWVGNGAQMSRVPGRITQAIFLSHEQGAPEGAWRLSTSEGLDHSAIPNLIVALRRYCKENEIPIHDGEPAGTPTPAPVPGRQTKILELPAGTTQAQAEKMVQDLSGKLGIKPNIIKGPH